MPSNDEIVRRILDARELARRILDAGGLEIGYDPAGEVVIRPLQTPDTSALEGEPEDWK